MVTECSRFLEWFKHMLRHENKILYGTHMLLYGNKYISRVLLNYPCDKDKLKKNSYLGLMTVGASISGLLLSYFVSMDNFSVYQTLLYTGAYGNLIHATARTKSRLLTFFREEKSQ